MSSRFHALLFALAVAAHAAAPAPTASITLGDGVTMDFVLVQPGSFVMGSDENTGDGDESPQHKVTITQPFYLGKFEVTQAQWTALMGDNPSEFKGPSRPVDTVSWNDCQRFLAKLSAKTGRKFTLPTEAQWEFACRAGSTTTWSFGERDTNAADYGWLGENSSGTTHPVGEKKPNAWGLHDMHGNVWEWCADFYTKHAYASKDAIDPRGPPPSEGHILRGGAWGEHPNNARSATRNCMGPDDRHNGTGFRCVMLVNP
ncbi:MAG TPA: formylglycine-generating enzyme family protein [Opitutaceae bacterium]|nr:formylglycine-generating enzyme family protein [Opitutaceae bacterium]